MRLWIMFAVVFLIGLGVLTGFTIVSSASAGVGGDTPYYLAIGQSLAAGHGYKNTASPWPDRPAYDRMPGWPAVLALALRAAPRTDPVTVARLADAVCLALAGAFFCFLTSRLGGRPLTAILAGIVVSLSPSLIYTSVQGLSEPCFVLFVAMGLSGVFAGGRWLYLGALALGMAPLVRANFVIVPLLFILLAVLVPTARRALFKGRLARCLIACALSMSPSLLWAVRNFSITSRFPLLSSLEGETFYGANNEVVANNLDEWGYWIMPNRIPGETPKLQLARTLPSDLALNDYYHRKAMAWITSHPRALPRLILGKFIRAFVPIPWVPLTASFIACSFRFALFVMYFGLLPFWYRIVDRQYLLLCLATLIAHVLTTAVYYGTFRFTSPFVEVLSVPCIFLGVQEWLGWRPGRAAHYDISMPQNQRVAASGQ